MEFPDIYNLDNFHPVKPDVLKIIVNNNIITVYYNDFQIDSILSTDNYICDIYNLNGSPVNNLLGNKVIRVITDDDADFCIGTSLSSYDDIRLYNNTIFKLHNITSIIIGNINEIHKCLIYIYDNNTIITQPACDSNFVSYAPRETLSLIHKLDGTFAYGIVFGCKAGNLDVNNYLVKMKYYNYYKSLIMIPSKCGKIELYYYKYVINKVVYLGLHKMINNNNTSIFATKDKKNRIKYDFNKFTKNLDNIPKQIEICIKNYNYNDGLFAFHTNVYI